MSSHEHEDRSVEHVVADIERNTRTVLRLLDLADLASAAFHVGDYQSSFEALADYHALRNEMAQTPFRI